MPDGRVSHVCLMGGVVSLMGGASGFCLMGGWCGDNEEELGMLCCVYLAAPRLC